jgi:DNA-nicking Smr family endonuclease
MNDPDNALKHNPFAALGKFIKGKVVLRSEPPIKPERQPPEISPSAPVNEESTFREAMEGVKPMARNKHYPMKKNVASPAKLPFKDPDREVRQHLDNLIKNGEGFIISQTPEYMEGLGRDIPAEFAQRLHRGDFSIQAHLDLHGLSVPEAKEAFEQFLHEALLNGKRGLLIIHGRGIQSPGEPVLKNKVQEWLTRSHWRKWVIAYASAQSYDGGAGATYVLLGHRPRAKGSRKN